MANNVYLIVSDLHLYYKGISGRMGYLKEKRKLLSDIAEIGMGYRKKGFENVNLLLLGDVFHRSYHDIFQACVDKDFFIFWVQNFGKCYSVVGNHELSFYESNPFFTLMHTIESEKVQRISEKVWAPKGLLQIINIVDRLDDGEVHFYFNHYSTAVSKPVESGVNVGLFHQEIVCNEIVSAMQNKFDGKIWAKTINFDNLDVFDGYQYCFLGHMHKIFGAWQGDNGCMLYYLASLGRTNIGEVLDNFLERDVPAVLVKDGKFSGVESNFIKLSPPKEIVDRQVVEDNAYKQQLQKQRKYIKEHDILDDDPVKSMERFFAEDETALLVMHELLERDIDSYGEQLRARFNRRINNGY